MACVGMGIGNHKTGKFARGYCGGIWDGLQGVCRVDFGRRFLSVGSRLCFWGALSVSASACLRFLGGALRRGRRVLCVGLKTRDAQTRRVCSVLRTGGVGGRSSPAKDSASGRVSAFYARARSAKCVASSYQKRVSQKRGRAMLFCLALAGRKKIMQMTQNFCKNFINTSKEKVYVQFLSKGGDVNMFQFLFVVISISESYLKLARGTLYFAVSISIIWKIISMQ